MKISLSISAFSIAMFCAAMSANACGNGVDGAAMCGKPALAQAQTSTPLPNATPHASTPAQASGGCECCKNMAMMKGMDDKKDLPGMTK